MSLVVHKYGGTSVGDFERLEAAAAIIRSDIQNGRQVVVVVSAMRSPGATRCPGTDELIRTAYLAATGSEERPAGDLTPDQARERDALVSLGEMFSASLLALTLQRQGTPALSLNALQAGLVVEGDYSDASITGVDVGPIQRALEAGKVPVLAGFQGRNDKGEVLTMARGCSDTSAVAIAAALKADECLIYTDVAGIYTADPRVVPEARPLSRVSCEEILEASLVGAQVLHPRSIRLARQYAVPLRVLSSFHPEQPGTLVAAAG